MGMGKAKTIKEVSQAVSDDREFTVVFKEFLDHFIESGSLAMLLDEPDYVAEDRERTYLAGAAEYLASYLKTPPPAWVEKDIYFLRKPIVFGGRSAMMQNIKDTPSSFRRRMLFCGLTLTKLHRYSS